MICILVAELAGQYTHNTLAILQQGLRRRVLLEIDSRLQENLAVTVKKLEPSEKGIGLVVPKHDLTNFEGLTDFAEIGLSVGLELTHFVPKLEIVLGVALIIHNGAQVVVHIDVALDRELTVLLLAHFQVGRRHSEDIHLE